MKLRVTTESDTHAYATSPLNFGGFSKEDMLILILPMAAMHHITGEPLHEVGLGIGVLDGFEGLVETVADIGLEVTKRGDEEQKRNSRMFTHGA